MNYEQYWQLREKPFEETADTRFFFESADHREALDRLLYVVHDRNMNIGLLTGEIGSGKTITKNVFKNTLSPCMFETVSFEISNFSFSDILYEIVSRITFRNPQQESPFSSDRVQRSDPYLLYKTLRKMLDIVAYEEQRHLVVIFDEAQMIEPAMLDEIKNLTNLSSESSNHVTIFLVGQPELREHLRIKKQIDQRIFLRYHLNNLDYANTVNYIRHRLRIAGLQNGSIFTPAALEAVFHSCGGIPREINRLCKLAMTYGIGQSLKEIDTDTIEVILDDMKKYH